MSMFRSAADISSSDPDSSSEESDNDLDNYVNADNIGLSGSQEDSTSIGLEELLLEEEQAPHGNGGILGNALDLDADGHSAVVTSALLEFYCIVRAADFLNAQAGSFGRFTHESPEAKQLGKQMYQYKSQFLSNHGIVAGGIDDDDWAPVRQYYRDNLDRLGNAPVEGVSTPTLPESRPPSRGHEPGTQHVSSTVKTLVQTSKPGPQPMVRQASHDKAGWDLQKRYPGYDNQYRPSQGFVQFNNLLRTPQYPGEQLTVMNTRPTPVLDRFSRYASEFLEVRLLGRGSFGQVFEAKNHVDGQNYAVKKIPLSKRRLEMLQQEGVHHFEHILKEIRTLARLDHKNVVRYFGAWVEENQVYLKSPSLNSEPEVESRIESLRDDPAGEDQSFGIVFGLSSNGEDDDSSSRSPQHTTSGSGSHRRGSHFTNGSSHSVPISNGDDDDDVESIQRNFSLPKQHKGFSHGHTSTWDRTDSDIFTNDMSQDPSKLQLTRRDDPENQTVILHIQMSLHPLTLSTYLSPENGLRDSVEGHSTPRHCFHILPSLRFLLGILSGVEYLHSKGIVHRDLKPANIFLSSRENGKDICHSCQQKNNRVANMYRPRIGDFGLVADISHCTDTQFPQATTVQDSPRRLRHVGTEFYCPRKSQFNFSHTTTNDYVIDEKLDVFALGVILFELTYRLSTKMERQMLLSELTRGGSPDGVKIPHDFEDKIDCGRTTLSNGMTVGQSLSQCIQGMLHPDSRCRLGCKDVRKSLQELVTMIEQFAL